MKQTLILTTAILLFSINVTAAPMLRVVGVADAQTIVVDRNGVAAAVRLANIHLNPADEAAAVDYLRAKIVGSWVLIENGGDGAYVYRSPDGLFVNGELSRGAWADSSTKMLYLGESFAAPQRAAAKAEQPQVRSEIQPPPKPKRARSTPKGATRIPNLPKSQR